MAADREGNGVGHDDNQRRIRSGASGFRSGVVSTTMKSGKEVRAPLGGSKHGRVPTE